MNIELIGIGEGQQHFLIVLVNKYTDSRSVWGGAIRKVAYSPNGGQDRHLLYLSPAASKEAALDEAKSIIKEYIR